MPSALRGPGGAGRSLQSGRADLSSVGKPAGWPWPAVFASRLTDFSRLVG